MKRKRERKARENGMKARENFEIEKQSVCVYLRTCVCVYERERERKRHGMKIQPFA